jgi:hypothetical protein
MALMVRKTSEWNRGQYVLMKNKSWGAGLHYGVVCDGSEEVGLVDDESV